MDSTLQFETQWSWSLICLAALAMVGLWLWLYRGQRSRFSSSKIGWLAIACRFAAIAVLAILWLQPTRVTEQTKVRPVQGSVAVDRSASMGINDAAKPIRQADDDMPDRAFVLERIAVAKVATGLAARANDAESGLHYVQRGVEALQSARARLIKRQGLSTNQRKQNQQWVEAMTSLEDRADSWTSGYQGTRVGQAGEQTDLFSLTTEIGSMWTLVSAGIPQTETNNKDAIVKAGSDLSDSDSEPSDPERLPGSQGNDKPTRLAAAMESLTGDDPQVGFFKSQQVVAFDGQGIIENVADPQAVQLASADISTDLNRAFESLAQQNGTVVDISIIATDGVQSASRKAVSIPDAIAERPLIMVAMGQVSNEDTVAINKLRGPDNVVIGDAVQLTATVSSSQKRPSQQTIEFLQDGQVVDTRQVLTPAGASTQLIRFDGKSKSIGPTEFQVRLVDGNVSAGNSAATHRVRITSDKLNVLLADSNPRWETRYLVSLLKRDKRTDVELVLFSSGNQGFPGYESKPAVALPLAKSAYQRFDVVVIGDLNPIQLTVQHQEVLQDYVRSGGQLLVIAGQEAMPTAYADQPLAELLPVEAGSFPRTPMGLLTPSSESVWEERFRLRDSDANQELWQSAYALNPVYWISNWTNPKPAAQSMLDAKFGSETMSALSIHPYGLGSVSFLATPSIYNLRLGRGDELHFEFWGRFFRTLSDGSLAQDRLIALSSSSNQTFEGESVDVQVQLRDSVLRPVTGGQFEIVAYQQNQAMARLPAVAVAEQDGLYSASLTGLPAGEYTLQAEGASIDTLLASVPKDVQDNQRTAIDLQVVSLQASSELTVARVRPALFKQVDSQPLGITVSPERIGAVLSSLQLLDSKQTSVSRNATWPTWPLLLLITGLLSTEWMLRRLAGVG
jgi:hypothetical protein